MDAVEADSREAFLQAIQEGDPRSYVIYHDKILQFADKKFASPREQYVPDHTDFINIPQAMLDWVEVEYPKPERPKSLVIYGPSRTGKTSWARSLGRHTYMNTNWNVDEIDVGFHGHVILDDIDFSTFRSWQAFLGKSPVCHSFDIRADLRL